MLCFFCTRHDVVFWLFSAKQRVLSKARPTGDLALPYLDFELSRSAVTLSFLVCGISELLIQTVLTCTAFIHSPLSSLLTKIHSQINYNSSSNNRRAELQEKTTQPRRLNFALIFMISHFSQAHWAAQNTYDSILIISLCCSWSISSLSYQNLLFPCSTIYPTPHSWRTPHFSALRECLKHWVTLT